MIAIGLTGGIGMGKTTAAEILQKRGVPVVDTDVLAREVLEPGQPALAEIQRVFGPEIIGSDGRLLREELGRIVFADAPRRRQLEAIVHPRIRERWLARMAEWRGQGEPLATVVIPLLFETNAAAHFDAIICVTCSPSAQRQRLLARGWTREQIEQRNQAQWPIEKKVAASHFVVWTEGRLEVHEEQLDRILSGIHAGPVTSLER